MGRVLNMDSQRILVVYYSRTGTTETVAQAIREELKGEIEQIRDTKKRSGILGWIRSGMDAGRKTLTQIEEVEKDPGDYGLVVIGSPTWNNTVSTPIRTYLTQYRDQLEKVAFFCTQGGDDSQTLPEMASIIGRKPLATLPLTKGDVDSGEYRERVKDFFAQLQQSLEQER
jgi:flavodoxin